MSSDPRILIVGAGPVGLTLALQLAQYNIKASIIDKAKTRSKFSKALTLTSASMKLFDGLGVISQMILKGKRCERAEIIYNKQKVAFVDTTSLASKYNYYLSLPQPETEKILEAQLVRYGGVVDYKHDQSRNLIWRTVPYYITT